MSKKKDETKITIEMEGVPPIEMTGSELKDAADKAAGIGHNSGENIDPVTRSRLLSIVERIERLESEKAAVAADIKDVYAEAKGSGYDTGTIRRIIRLRAMDSDKLAESAALLQMYGSAVGLQAHLL